MIDVRPLKRCCVTMALDHINAAMTYVMWHEEHLWNVSVLQRADLSTLVHRMGCAAIFAKKTKNSRSYMLLD
jgi:hypothetical protein